MSFDFENVVIAVAATLMTFAGAIPLIAIVCIVRDAAMWVMQDPDGVAIAGHGDDWVSLYWSGRKTCSTTVLITHDFWSSVGISFDESLTVWHSAVGVELVGWSFDSAHQG